jgi:toxin CcdB
VTVAQFDAYANPSVAQREAFPYVVVLQNDQFGQFTTRFVMPLSRLKSPPWGLPRRLSQTVVVSGERLWLAPHLCATLPDAC